MSQIVQQMLDIGYHVETNGLGINTVEKSMPEVTKDNPWPMICVTQTHGNGVPADAGPFLIGYHQEHGMGTVVDIELSGPRAAELLIPILRTLELNLPK